MKEIKYLPNSNGKYEFDICKEIGQDTKNKYSISHRFAQTTIAGFTDTFGITDERITVEADIPTFVKMLGDVLMEYEELILEYNTSNHLPSNLRDSTPIV